MHRTGHVLRMSVRGTGTRGWIVRGVDAVTAAAVGKGVRADHRRLGGEQPECDHLEHPAFVGHFLAPPQFMLRIIEVKPPSATAEALGVLRAALAIGLLASFA